MLRAEHNKVDWIPIFLFGSCCGVDNAMFLEIKSPDSFVVFNISLMQTGINNGAVVCVVLS